MLAMTIEHLMWAGGVGVVIASFLMSAHMREVARDRAGELEGHLMQERELLNAATTPAPGHLGDHLDKAA